MKNIIKIFLRDLKKIFTNWVAVIVVIALMAIPSLYSLVNIYASWDPYGNTSGVKVAIVNDDEGTEFKDKDINLGDELVNKLKDNDQIGWCFVDKDTAENGLLNEEYYASVEIPEDFSESITTLVEKDISKPKLKYTVNEKPNAIAPKFTDAAVKTVKSQLDENIVKTVTGIIFRLCNDIGVDVQDNRPEIRKIMDKVYDLDEKMPELQSSLDAAIDGTNSVSNFIEKANEVIPIAHDICQSGNSFLNDTSDSLDDMQSKLDDDKEVIKDDLTNVENILDTSSVVLGNIDENVLPETVKKTLITVSESTDAMLKTNSEIRDQLKDIKKFINKVSNIEIPRPDIDPALENIDEIKKLEDAYNEQVDALESMQDNLKKTNSTINDILDRLDTIDEKLNIISDRINNKITDIDNGEKIDVQFITDSRKLIDETHGLVTDIIDKYSNNLTGYVDSTFDSLKILCDKGFDLVNQGESILPDVENTLATFSNVTDMSREELLKLKDKFPDLIDQVHTLSEKMKMFDNDDDIDELLELITNDWSSQSDFMASPVEIEDNRLFPLPNYGSAATPFYTILCLWIGGYMLSILLATEVHELEDGTKVKPYETYFGKLLLFIFIGVFQAIIASLGAIFILKVYVVHPVMFVFYTIFVGIVFMIMIYTAVSLFGHGGIVYGIVLLVMQVAGTSGNFPIEVNPKIYQVIFPMLPFNYAISGMRQIMAGIVYKILFKDIIILVVFMTVSLILGITCKKVSNKWIDGFVKKLKESKLMAG